MANTRVPLGLHLKLSKAAEGEPIVGWASDGSGGLMENPDAGGAPQALGEAMRKLGVKIGTPNDGCEEIRLIHQFGSVVDDEFGFVAR